MAAQRYAWPVEEQRERLVQSLRGGASIFFSRLPQEVRTNYQVLLDRLMSRFGKRDPPTTVRRQIAELRQKKDESLEAFAERARELAVDGYPDAAEATIKTVAADAFLTGCCNKDAVFYAMQQRPENVSRALELVREATHNHRAIYGAGEKKVRVTSEPEVRQVTEPATKVLEKLADQMSQVLQLLSASAHAGARPSRSRTRIPSPGDICFQCGKQGHFRQNCPEEKAKVRFKSPSRSPSPAERNRSPSPARPLNGKGPSPAASNLS
jgi:hypothetical protein